MDHFVRQHPVFGQLRCSCGPADVNADYAAVVGGKSPSAMYALPVGNDEVQRHVSDREAQIISGHGFGGVADPTEQFVVRQSQFTFFEADVDAGVSDLKGGEHLWGPGGASAGEIGNGCDR